MKAISDSTGQCTTDHPTAELAQSEPSLSPPESRDALRSALKRQTYAWGDEYTGTKEVLIAAGLAYDGQFPGDSGRIGGTQHFDQSGNPTTSRLAVSTIRRYAKKFQLRVSVSKEVEQARRQAEAATNEWRQKAAEAEAEVRLATDALADLPSSKKEYARRAAEAFWSGYHVFYSPYSRREPGDAGYQFDAADRERFSAMALRLYWEIRKAKPRFDAVRRMSKVTAARAKAAKVDMPLQRLLSAAVEAKLLGGEDDAAGEQQCSTAQKQIGASNP